MSRDDPPCDSTKKEMGEKGHGPNYYLNIEDNVLPWNSPTISREEIAELGGWQSSQGVVEIDLKSNETRTLAPGEVVELKPGKGFSKKHLWRRGGVFEERVTAELELLRSVYPDVRYDPRGHWFMIPEYRDVGGQDWRPCPFPVAFRPQPGHPATEPYGIWIPHELRVQGQQPLKGQHPANEQPPFPGRWSFLSWRTQANHWKPQAKISEGSNLLNFALGFRDRFQSGR